MNFEQPEQKILKFFLILVCLFIGLQYFYSVGVLCFKGTFVDLKLHYVQSEIMEKLRYNPSPEEISEALLSGRGIFYPPVFWLIFFRVSKFFSFLPFQVLAVLWLWLNQLLLFLAILFLAKAVGAKEWRLLEIAFVVFLVLSFLPLDFNNQLGQYSVVIFFLLSGAIFSLKRQKDILAGVLIALATCLKWIPAVLFLFFLIKRYYRVVISGVITLILAFCGSFFYYGKLIHLVQFEFILRRSAFLSSWLINHSLSAFWRRLLTTESGMTWEGGMTQGVMNLPWLSSLLTSISVLALIVLSCRIIYKGARRADSFFALEYSLFVVLSILISSYIHIHHLVLLLLPFIVIVLICQEKRQVAKLFPFFLGSYLLTGLEYWPDGLEIFRKGWGVLFLSGRFYGTFLLWLGIYLFLKKHRKSN